jgi:tripartite-type tricarboxylate transporter receptor subunit TctC
MRPRIVATLIAAVLPAFPLNACADTMSDFYKGKTVTLIIGAGVGGSQDAFARLVTHYLGKHIPGNPTVIGENMPGAGGVQLLAHMAHVAPKDGLTIGTAPAETVFDPLFSGRSAGQFDPQALQWIGGPVRFSAVAIAWNTATAIRKADDLLTEEMKVGASSAASASATDGYVLRKLLGFKYDVILGYQSGGDIDLAMLRGETQGRANVAWDGLKSRNPDWIQDGKISLLYQEGLRKNPQIPADVPLVLDFAKTDADRQMLELKFSSYEVGYPFMMAPDTPPERVAVLRTAMAAAFADPDLRAEAAKERLDIDPIGGEETEAIVKRDYQASASTLSRLVAAMQPPSEHP